MSFLSNINILSGANASSRCRADRGSLVPRIILLYLKRSATSSCLQNSLPNIDRHSWSTADSVLGEHKKRPFCSNI